MYRLAKSICRDLERSLRSRNGNDATYWGFRADAEIDRGRVKISTNVALPRRVGDTHSPKLSIAVESPSQIRIDPPFEPSDYSAARRLRIKGFRKIHNRLTSPEHRKHIVTTVALLMARRGSILTNG
jgi:hypothetical protein